MTGNGLIYLYKMLSLGFSYPEEKNWIMLEKMLYEGESLLDGEILAMLKDFKNYFTDNRHRINDVKSEYLDIFDMGRKISPYETEYLTEKISRKPFELADISGFYSAFGFGINEDMTNKESADHISVELEFMAIIALKEEYARGAKQKENENIVHDAGRKFLNDHLAKWGFYYCSQIQELEFGSFYKKLGSILESLLSIECDRYGLDAMSFKKKIERDVYDGVREEVLACGHNFSPADE
ncbi:MAG: molecular chaperone TorD family protein [Nitrospirota bacterium]